MVGLLIGATAGFLCAWLFVSRAAAAGRRAADRRCPQLDPDRGGGADRGALARFGQPSKIAVVALMTFAPMVVNAFKGLYSVDRQALDLMDSVAASPWQVFVKLRLPGSLPYVFSALKVGITLALIGALVSEFFNAQRGLGDHALEQHPGGQDAAGLGRDRGGGGAGAGAVRPGQPGRARRDPLARLVQASADLQREADGEGRALTGDALDGQVAAHQATEVAADREAEAGPAVLAPGGLASAWENASNRRPSCSSVMPMPVSETAKVTRESELR